MSQNKIKLKEKQSVVFADTHRFKIVHAGTRFGKTYLICAWLMTGALNNPNWLVWHVLPTYRMGKQIAYPVYNRFLPSWYITEKNKSDLSWHFSNGSVLAIRGAEDPDTLLGVGLNRVGMDEMQRINPEAWTQTIRARLTNTLGEALIGGTPRGKNHFYKMMLKAKTLSDWRVFNYKTIEGENVSADEIENARQSLTERQYREQFHGTFEDVPGALWNQDAIDKGRIEKLTVPLLRIVIAIDPAVSNKENSDETGIIVCGLGADRHFYVLKDVSGHYSPREWAEVAIEEYHSWRADRMVGEVNNGGDLVESNVLSIDNTIAFKKVTATKGKALRAEPISALYERGIAHHVGRFFNLEEQMCLFSPLDTTQDSPDRMDALVWGGTELIIPQEEDVYVEYEEDYSIAKY